MTEATSNLHHYSFLNSIDVIITPFNEQDFSDLQPDILITLGGMVVSKRIKAFLREYKPAEHWHIDTLRAYDTFGALTQHFLAEPNNFFSNLLQYTATVESNYNKRAQELKAYRKAKHDKYLQEMPFSDFKAFEVILPALKDYSQLQISNSAAIRYLQLFDLNPTIQVFCNRGTSGIDGSTSTAIGAALASGKETVLITGDVSFFYDSNALWNSYIPENFKIIIINNNGGGIFRILPGHQENPVFNTYFETTHQLNAVHLAKMYGFQYQSASDEEVLREQLSGFMENSGRQKILEVFTPLNINDKVLKQYFKELV